MKQIKFGNCGSARQDLGGPSKCCLAPTHRETSVIFVLIYFLILVLVFQLFSSFSFVLVSQYFFVLVFSSIAHDPTSVNINSQRISNLLTKTC